MKRPAGYFDQTHYHDYRYEAFVPALTVISAGVSRWGAAVRYYRARPIAVSVNIVTAGDARFTHRDYAGVVKPGQVTITQAGSAMTFATGPSGMLHKRFLVLGGDVLAAYLSSSGLDRRQVLSPADPRRIVSLFRQAYGIMAAKEGDFVSELSVVAHRVLNELARCIAHQYPSALSRAIEFMQRNLAVSLTLKDICAACGVGQRSCIRMFNQHLGMPPIRFFLEQRMRWAQHLLRTTELSVKEIAWRLGYEEPLYFSAQFKKHVGVSPKRFRDMGYVETDLVDGGKA